MNGLYQDVRYGLRMFAKNPGFTAIAVLTLALGIGANAAIFSVVNAVLLRPLPFAQSERMVAISETLPGFAGETPLNAPDYSTFTQRQRSFETLGVYSGRRFELSGNGGDPERVQGARASATLFPLLGAQPQLGRIFAPDEDQPGHNVAILSNGLWKRRYGADPNILGTTISLERVPYTVVGVMPAGFTFPLKGQRYNSDPADVWVPMAFSAYELQAWGNMYNHSVLARLKPGITVAQAQDDASAVMAEIEKMYPAELTRFLNGRHVGISVLPYSQVITGNVRTPLLVLLVAVGVVLLIACANVANLLIARASGRQREIAVRTAMGAGRARMIRQMLSESLLLGLASGVIALGAGQWGIGVLRSLAPEDIPRMQGVQIDARVLGFAFLLSIVTAALFGIIPALQATHVDPHDALKEGGRGTGASRRGRRLQSGLIVSQMALAVMLLIGAGLLVRSFARLLNTDPGFRQERVLTMTVSLPLRAYPRATDIRNFYEELMRRTGALPGVSSVGFSTDLPLNAQERDAVTLEGREVTDNSLPDVAQSWIMGAYFDTMGITLKRGRMFTPEERRGKPNVVVVSETAARIYWPGQDPIGKRIRFMGPGWRTVIGVAADVKETSMAAAASPHTYTPYLQEADEALERPVLDELRTLNVAVRTQADPAAVTSAVRGAIASLDSQVAVANIKTMESAVHQSLAPQRFNLFLLGLFAALAVFLASVGVYGVLSYSVTQRTQEIGIRMAIGAQPSTLLVMTIYEGMKLTVIGGVLGLAGAYLLTQLMASLLYGVTAHDPPTFVGVAALLCLVSFAACYIPARRATRIDPLVALRYE
jgi:putative ABC transport system permease protein